MKSLLDQLVCGYLRWVPVTEGKGRIYRWFARRDWPTGEFEDVRTKDGFLLRLNPHNEEHRRIYYYGEHDERYELALLRKIIQPGDVFWDIGSNIGYYSCLAARLVGKSGKVVAFEPAPTTREYLEKNIDLNAFLNTLVIPYAVGERDEIATIHMSDPLLGEGTASLNASDDKSFCVDVEVRRLDNLSSTLPTPNLVKIDVEGVFGQLWRGARSFFSGHAPIIMAELKGESFVSAEGNLGEDIAVLGYSMFEIHKHSIRQVSDPADSKKRNFILVKQNSPAFSRLEPLVA
ncbi:MAG: FkbM family methyltransferase [Sulfuritalea sp.]|nr:FkbM family methyltransferase [Sulfuritalea sp.]